MANNSEAQVGFGFFQLVLIIYLATLQQNIRLIAISYEENCNKEC